MSENGDPPHVEEEEEEEVVPEEDPLVRQAFEAVFKGDAKTLRSCIADGLDVNSGSDELLAEFENCCLIALAITCFCREVGCILPAGPASTRVAADALQNSLQRPARCPNQQRLQALRERSHCLRPPPSLQAQLDDTRSLSASASRRQRAAVLRELLKQAPRLRFNRDDGMGPPERRFTVLHLLSRARFTDEEKDIVRVVVRAAVRDGVDVNTPGSQGTSALEFAALENQPLVLQELLGSGAGVRVK